MKIQYSLSRCRKNKDLYGSSHLAEDDKKTLCGLEINENWYITGHNIHSTLQPTTCKKCLKLSKALQ